MRGDGRTDRGSGDEYATGSNTLLRSAGESIDRANKAHSAKTERMGYNEAHEEKNSLGISGRQEVGGRGTGGT